MVYTINTRETSTPSRPPSRKTGKPRDWTITALGAMMLVSLGLLAWKLWPKNPSPSAPAPVLVKFTAGDDFARLTPEQKQPYVDALSKIPRRELFAAAETAKLTDDERMNAMENVMSVRFNKTLDEYFALQPGAERNAFLDKMITEQQKRMTEWRSRPRPTSGPAGNAQVRGGAGGRRGAGMRGGGGGWGNRWMDPARQKRRTELTPPGRRAEVAEFFAAMRARRAAHGLPNRR